MRPDVHNRSRAWWIGSVVFLMLSADLMIRHPLEFAGTTAVVATAVVAVLAAVTAFRHHVLARIPERLTSSPSRPVRLTTRLVRTYATYLVGFYAVIAVLVLVTIISHFI